MTTTITDYRTSHEELDSRWESFLNGKRDDIRRQHVNQATQFADQRDENDPAQDKYATRDEREGIPAMEPIDSNAGGVDMFKVFEMFKLVEKGNWSALADHVQKNPQSTFVRMAQGKTGFTLSSKGNLLLHEVCRYNPSLEVVNALITLNGAALKSTGEHGRLPLHFACACGASAEVVQRLINGFPDGAKIRDTADLMLPLHLACKWGASKVVLKALLAANPDGRNVRDIYAKSPMDYARGLASKEVRESMITCLQANVRKQVTFKDRSSMVHNNAVDADNQQENLELSKNVKGNKQGQESRMKSLEEEFTKLQNLQATNKSKKAVLEKKIEILLKANEVKQELIERLEQENGVKYNQELKQALQAQEEKYRRILKIEQYRVAELERRAKEVEITHRMYTNAILEEHEQEAQDFEAFTLQFKALENQLRAKLNGVEERNEFLELELSENRRRFEEQIAAEKEKVTFLEGHVFKVNNLLESEQQRFQELEDILKQTIDLENEQKGDMSDEEFSKMEKHYQAMLKNEQNKIATLQHDYDEVNQLLKLELEKVSAFHNRENELKRLVELQQRKLRQLQDTEKQLESERHKCQLLQQSEAQTLSQLAAEQDKVKLLERRLRAVQHELKTERATVMQLRAALEKKQAEYEEESKKIKELQMAQTNKLQVIESLRQKVAMLEEALAESKSIANQGNAKLESVIRELDEVKYLLAKEKHDVAELNDSQKQLATLLESEKLKIKNLEQAQVVAEAEIQSAKDDDVFDESAQRTLVENQKLLYIERARIANMKEEQHQLHVILESKNSKVESLMARLGEKESELRVEKRKFAALEKQQLVTEDILQSEQKRADQLEKEHRECQNLLEAEQEHIQSLESALMEAKSHIESVEGKLGSLNQAKMAVGESFNNIEKEQMNDVAKIIANFKSQLDAEQELVHGLELELSEAQAVCHAEKRKVAELKKAYEHANAELQSERKVIDNLEQDRGRKNVIIESEQNKVRALEHARDQLQALLEWERKTLKSHIERHSDAERRLSAAERKMSETMSTLNEKTEAVDVLMEQLQSLGELRKEVIRLNAQTRQRDVLLAAILKTVGNDEALLGKECIKEAKLHVGNLKRIVGLDLAGLDDNTLRQGGALVPFGRRDMVTMRRIRRTLVWTIPLIPIIAISQDPSILTDLTSSLDPQMLHDMTAHFAALSANFDPTMIREMTRDLTSNLASNFDASMIREPISQMFGMATQIATGSRLA